MLATFSIKHYQLFVCDSLWHYVIWTTQVILTTFHSRHQTLSNHWKCYVMRLYFIFNTKALTREFNAINTPFRIRKMLGVHHDHRPHSLIKGLSTMIYTKGCTLSKFLRINYYHSMHFAHNNILEKYHCIAFNCSNTQTYLLSLLVQY